MNLASIITTAVNPWAKYKWAAIALVVVLWHIAYGAFWSRHGRLELQNAQTAAIAKANVESFKTTERLQRNVDEASTLAATRAADDRARAASADRAISGMRNTLDATQRHAQESLAAASATVSAYRAVFESCTAEYRAVGAEAAGHARDSLMYQDGWPK